MVADGNSDKNPKTETASVPDKPEKPAEVKEVKAEGESVKEKKTPPPVNGPEATSDQLVYNTIQDHMIALLLVIIAIIQYIVTLLGQILVALADASHKTYNVAYFAYTKPEHTKKLIRSTYNLIKDSYDAELWTFRDIFTIISQQIAPMTRTPAPSQVSTPVTQDKKDA